MSLIDFILKAKRSGYAGGSEGNERKFDDGSVGFEIIADGYRYLDRYYGFNPFAGAEYIFDSGGKLLWIMNYYGEVLSEKSDSKKVYSFLKEAMRLISPEYPFRGPAQFEKENFAYKNVQNGTLACFNGTESIYESGERVYFLHYHGGRMTKRR